MSRPRVHVHAVGLALDPGRAVSSEVLCASVGRLLDAAVAGDRQAVHLVALPEHTGLLAMLVGERGAQARAVASARAPAAEVLMALAAGYADELEAVGARFPTVTAPMTLLHLAVADTVLRVLLDGFGALAADRSVWLSVAAALPMWTRDDGPAARVRFPPAGAQIRNRNLVLGPDGGLAAVHDKAYLVEVEHASDGFGMTAAGLDDVQVTQLPIGRVASVISKDAWMPDVNDRLDQLGAQVLLQPEAFDRWGRVDRGAGAGGGSGGADLWPPDKLQRGGWWMVRRHPAPVVNVTPMLLGELGELRFDGQALIATAAPGPRPWRGLLGQPSDIGWAAVGPWRVVAEPVDRLADPGRRAAFERADLAAGARASIDHDHLVGAEVTIPPDPVPTPPPPPGATASTAVGDPAGAGMQLAPDLAVHADGARLVWVDVGGVADQGVLTARFDGHRWSEPTALDAADARRSDGAGRRWRPRVVATTDGAVCLHLGFPAGSWDVLAVPLDDGGAVAGPVRVDDAHCDAGVRRERGHDAPCLGVDGGDVVAVWSDLRWPWVLPQVRASRSRDGGRSWSPSHRVDGGAMVGQPDPLAPRSPHETRGQTAPAVAAVPGGLVVVWQELGAAGWPAIWGVTLRDGHPTSPPIRLDDGTAAAYRPALAARGTRVWLAYERVPDRGGSVVLRCSDDAGATFGPARVVDPARPPGVTQRRATIVPSAVGAPGTHVPGGATVVVEDDRAGQPRVLAVTVDGAADPLAVVRVDDAPDGAAARAPTAVRSGGEVLVVWQDTRGGREHLRSALLAQR